MSKDLFRIKYTNLTDAQKLAMQEVKEDAQDMLAVWEAWIPTEERSERARCMAIARTHLETAIMFAVKAITTEEIK